MAEDECRCREVLSCLSNAARRRLGTRHCRARRAAQFKRQRAGQVEKEQIRGRHESDGGEAGGRSSVCLPLSFGESLGRWRWRKKREKRRRRREDGGEQLDVGAQEDAALVLLIGSATPPVPSKSLVPTAAGSAALDRGASSGLRACVSTERDAAVGLLGVLLGKFGTNLDDGRPSTETF